MVMREREERLREGTRSTPRPAVEECDHAIASAQQFGEVCDPLILKMLEKQQAGEDPDVLKEVLPRIQSFPSMFNHALALRGLLKAAVHAHNGRPTCCEMKI